jgi:hypothetical protein
MKPSNSFNSKLTRQAPDLPSGSPAPDTPPAATPSPASAPDLSFIPATYHTDGQPDVSKFAGHYQELVAEQARFAERQAAVPETYEFALPADMKFDGLELPPGYQQGVDTANPLFGELGSVLKELGAPADAAGKMTALLARYEAGKEAANYAAWKQDMAQLGTPDQYEARAKDVLRKLETLLPKDQVEALFFGPRITANGIKALEKLITDRSLQAPPANPQGQDIENMTPMQKLQLANRQRA